MPKPSLPLLLSDSIHIQSNITFDHLKPLSTYLGKPGYGFVHTAKGDPTDGFGRNIYVDTYNSRYGAGWKRENSFLTHPPTRPPIHRVPPPHAPRRQLQPPHPMVPPLDVGQLMHHHRLPRRRVKRQPRRPHPRWSAPA